MDLTAYPWIVGAFIPIVISFVKKADWDIGKKRMAAVGVSLVAALASYFIQHQGWVGWQTLVQDFAVIYALGQVTYAGFWEGTVVDVKATSFGA